MDDKNVLSIEKLENGYEVSVCDPKVAAANKKGKGGWQDPMKDYAFKTVEEVVAFITEHLDTLEPPPDADEEYASEFKRQSGDE